MGKKQVMNITFREFQIQIHKLGPSLFQVVRHLRYTYTISEIQIHKMGTSLFQVVTLLRAKTRKVQTQSDLVPGLME